LSITFRDRTVDKMASVCDYPCAMRIIRGIKNYSEKFPNPVLTLGNFDGVHLGHQAIFKKVVERAKEIGGTAIAFTFEPHPLKVLSPDRSPLLLNTFHGKMKLIESSGIQAAICADFTREFAEQNPEDFAKQVLVEKIGVATVLVGRGYRFGQHRAGDLSLLTRLGSELGFAVQVVEKVTVDGTPVSSTGIRQSVRKGDLLSTSRHLGRLFSLRGRVAAGRGMGSKLGFPTANLVPERDLLPPDGVYAGWALVEGEHLPAAIYIGQRPTFPGAERTVEVHILDGTWNLLGKQLAVQLLTRLRPDEAFSDTAALVEQISRDVKETRTILANEVRHAEDCPGS